MRFVPDEGSDPLNELSIALKSLLMDDVANGKIVIVFFFSKIELGICMDVVNGIVPVVGVMGDSTPDDKYEALKALSDGTLQVLFATTAMSMGVDVDFDCCYHVGLAYSYINYYQEIGRVGRRGKAGFCQIITSDK